MLALSLVVSGIYQRIKHYSLGHSTTEYFGTKTYGKSCMLGMSIWLQFIWEELSRFVGAEGAF